MMTDTNQQITQPNGAAPPPALDQDAARYAELAKELGVEQEGREPEPAQQQGEPELQPEAGKGKPEHVPYGEHENVQKALREARAAQKASDERLAQLMRIVEDARGPRGQQPVPAAEAPKLPEVQEDPIAHYNARIAQLEQQLQQITQGSQQDTQQIRAHLQEQAMWQTVQVSETEIRSQRPDYDDACQHLESARIRQLERMYPSDAPQVQAFAQQQGFANANEYKLHLLNQDRRSVAMHALQTGVSPAQLYYDLALDSGYQPKVPKSAGNGVARGQQQLQATKRGQAASVSISGGASSAKATDELSVSDLAQMYTEAQVAGDEKELARLDGVFEKMGKLGRLG
jgi:hypothetical protein